MVAMIEASERTNNNLFKYLFFAVNSPPLPQRDIARAPGPAFRPSHDDFVPIQRRPEKSNRPDETEPIKKDKKWSLGKLFRRKKKDGSSSSESEDLSSKSSTKRKSKKKKKIPAVNNFDHVVMRNTRRAQSLAKPSTIQDLADDGVLSDPSAGFLRTMPHRLFRESKESLSLREDSVRLGRSVLDTSLKKTRKSRLKARVEALRNSMRGNSSSDEESIKSSNSSSILRFRSEDSLMRSRDSSLNRRSRSARNERYIKRLSRDDENQLNKEAELLQQGYTKAEIEMLTRTPTSQSSGYGTCKRDQNNKILQDNSNTPESNRRPLKSESISSFPSTQSYPSSINFNAKVNNEHINYSLRYPTHQSSLTNVKDPLPHSYRERSVPNKFNETDNVMCIKFPLGNITNVKREEKAPPVPPPRDMHRKVTTPLSMYYENIVDNQNGLNQQTKYGVLNNDFNRVMRRSQERTGLRRPISNSEDHIAMQNYEYYQAVTHKNEQPRRPASVSAEPQHYGLYMNTPPWRRKIEHANIVKPQPSQQKQDYLYFADQNPRSRRPISIKSGEKIGDYMSDSQSALNLAGNIQRRPRNASEFWKQIDEAEKHRNGQNLQSTDKKFGSNAQLYRETNLIEQNPKTKDPFSSDALNRNSAYYNNQHNDVNAHASIRKNDNVNQTCNSEHIQKVISPGSKTHVRHKSDTFLSNNHIYQPVSDDEKHTERRKSTNLDDALNELEAIYNSLGLGDEDLLDRAERRELMAPRFSENFNDWNGNDEELRLRSQPTTPFKRTPRRSTLPDKINDDMAFRRLNSQTKDNQYCKDNQAQVSYMLASPVYVPYASDDDKKTDRNEPDIVYDDVLYRSITQTNNRLKTLDPQPLFGIPVGPVSPAPLSDYLHATPENKTRSRFVARQSPDIVSDDLAYRNLRKDHRNSYSFNGEENNSSVNNKHTEYPFSKESSVSLKKKRAVRSLSANIFTMIQKEIDDALQMSKTATIKKTNSNSDVMKRLRETYECNENSVERYPRNKVKQRHNTVGLFVNNSHTPANHFTKDDSFIHDEDKCKTKSSSLDKSKTSSPLNRSLHFPKRSSKDEFQHVLTMLAQEAMDTSNKLGVALAELDKNRNSSEKTSEVSTKISDSRANFLNSLTNSYNNEPTQIKFVNVHSEIVNETELENNENKNYKSKGEKTKDSLLAISDQLHKAEDKLKHSFEKELIIDDDSHQLSDYISKLKSTTKAQESMVQETQHNPKVVPVSLNNDSIKVKNENLTEKQKQETNVQILPKYNSLNPFLNTDDQFKEIEDSNAFRELKDGISDLIAGISKVNEKLLAPKQNDSENYNKISGISEATEKLNQASQCTTNNNKPNRASVNLSIYEDDLEVKKDMTNSKRDGDSTEYNSSEELATIFKLESSMKSQNYLKDNSPDNIGRGDLSSPKLVQSVNQHLRRLSIDQTIDGTSSQSSLPNNIVPWRTKQQNSNFQNDFRGEK